MFVPVPGKRACMRQRSRAQIASSVPLSSWLIKMQSFSWYSAPHISSTDIVSSPSLICKA